MASSKTAIRGVMALMAAGAMAAAPNVAFADSLTQISVDCGDGYPLNVLVASAATLNGIQADVSEMALSPAGLSCTLSTTPVTVTTSLTTSTTPSSPTTGSPTSNTDRDGSVTGAGRYVDNHNCLERFGWKAHFDEDSSDPNAAHGKSNVTQRADEQTDPNCTGGHLESTVMCLDISTDPTTGNGIAQTISQVTESDGYFAAHGAVAGSFIQTDGTAANTDKDSDDPSQDRIDHKTVSTPPPSCKATGGAFQLTRGHITIHQEQPAEEDD